MKVFLDTNVLVSAFATRGLCADLLRHVLAEHELVTGEAVLKELQRVLTERIRLPAATVRDILALLMDHSPLPVPEDLSRVIVRDPDDIPILASALAARADVLITGDKDLLELGTTADILITNPRGFWELMRSGAP